jgi:hypothetical protein
MLVVAAIAHRDVASAMLSGGACAPTDWAWQSQLRHYWDAQAKDCHVRVADARIAYGWEYNGGAVSGEAVLLAHCDKAVTMAAAALRRDSGLLLLPADGERLGVPVSFYSQALARACGRLVMHVECTHACSYLELTRMLQVLQQHRSLQPHAATVWEACAEHGMHRTEWVCLQGIVSLGAWGHLCGVDTLDAGILSFLSGAITKIHAAIAARADHTNIANVQVSLQHQTIIRDVDALPFALLYSLSCASEPAIPLRASSTRALEEYLLTHTRRVVLMSAPIALMLEAALRCATLATGAAAATVLCFG